MRAQVLFAISAILAGGLAAPATAQQTVDEMTRFVIISSKTHTPVAAPAAKPYQAVAVKLPVAAADSGFESFRNEVAGVAKTRVYVELERLVTAAGFFWDRDFNGGFDHRRAGVDNLAAAVKLEHGNGTGWARLERFAGEITATPFTGRPGIICAPGEPAFDEVEFNRMLDATRSNAREWAYPRTEKISVHAAAQNKAAAVATLGLALVRVLGNQPEDQASDVTGPVWPRVATPAGKIGYVAPGTLASLAPERLCYGRDGFGRWRIAGYVGGGGD